MIRGDQFHFFMNFMAGFFYRNNIDAVRQLHFTMYVEFSFSIMNVRIHYCYSPVIPWDCNKPEMGYYYLRGSTRVISFSLQNPSSVSSLFTIPPVRLPLLTALATERIPEELSPQANTPAMLVL